MKKTLFILLLLPQLLLGQAGFERVYLFDDTLSRFSNIYVTDSCYYLFGQKGNNFERVTQHFSKLDLNGNVLGSYEYQFPNAIHFAGFPYQSKSTINFRGNFVYGYTVLEAGVQRPFLTEVSPNGGIVFDSLYTQIWEQDSLDVSYSNFEVLSDSTYLVAYSYGDYSSDTGGMWFDGIVGVIVMKIKYTGEILWKKRFYHPNFFIDTRGYQNMFLEINNDNSFTLAVRDYDYNTTSSIDLGDNAKIHFISCDENGLEISRQTLQDTPFCWGTSGFFQFNDGSSLTSYLDSYFLSSPPFPPNEYGLKSTISFLSPSKSIIWKKEFTIDGWNDISEYNIINDFIVKDCSIVFAIVDLKFNSFTDIDFSFNLYSNNILSGDKKWKREFNYFVEDSIQTAGYSISDVDTTYDDGYILAGFSYRPSQNIGDKPRNYGYILKTNCLGFLGSPQASVTVLSSSLDSVVFVNSSIQAGSYFWDFGDGNTLQTGENSDTISHVYTQAGTYTVKLIAEGCNGDNDTLIFSHTIASPPQTYGDGTLLSVFPNPTVSGQDATIYIGNISGTHELLVTDLNGKKVASYSIEQGETTYFVPTTKFATGMYQFSLVQNGEVKEIEKLIIE